MIFATTINLASKLMNQFKGSYSPSSYKAINFNSFWSLGCDSPCLFGWQYILSHSLMIIPSSLGFILCEINLRLYNISNISRLVLNWLSTPRFKSFGVIEVGSFFFWLSLKCWIQLIISTKSSHKCIHPIKMGLVNAKLKHFLRQHEPYRNHGVWSSNTMVPIYAQKPWTLSITSQIILQPMLITVSTHMSVFWQTPRVAPSLGVWLCGFHSHPQGEVCQAWCA